MTDSSSTHGVSRSSRPVKKANLEDMEEPQLADFLGAIFERSGVDFRDYAYSSLRRRVANCLHAEEVDDLDALRRKVWDDPVAMERLIHSLTVHVTSMFRDPHFYRLVREQLVPIWKTYPFLRLWVAGCSTGEEVYSLAILLQEEALYHRCRLYATDLSDRLLARAKAGVFPLSQMQDYTRAYQEAGGRAAFCDYYTASEEAVIFRTQLRENIVFAAHNLVGDNSFNEFHGIFCRNVMIYFNRHLQNRVHGLLYESLAHLGYLGLGRSESLRFTPYANCYEAVSTKERLFRKIA